MWLKSCNLFSAFAAILTYGFIVSAFDDPISLLGRIRWNYTSYEENLWTRTYKNTTLQQIYNDHNQFMGLMNSVYDPSDTFYPIFNASTSINKNTAIVDAFVINRYRVPVINSVVVLNAQVGDYWSKFANWTSFNTTNMLDVLTDDAIPILQSSLNTFWNQSNTNVYFDFLKNQSQACINMDQSQLPTYKLTEKYFINTMIVQLKAYVMIQLSYLTKAAKDFVTFHKTARDQRIAFNYQYAEFTQQSESLMWNLSRVVWACDDFNANESYSSLTNFIQGYVDNEINLSPDGSCAPYCSDFKVAKNYNCKANTLCAAKNKTRCEGTVRDCGYFGPTFSYCPNSMNSDQNRRIDFVRLGSGRLLGHENDSCDKYEAKTFMMWLTTCRYCFCYCDTPGPNSDRYFSLRDVTSNISDNKVISGIRLVKKNGIIHLTAIERSLLPNTLLDSSTKHEITNYNFTLTDPQIQNGFDYFTMTYDNRTLNLDTIVAPRDQIVTGVRFRHQSGSVHLEVRFTYFDEDTGKLDLTTASEWKSNSNMQRNLIQSEHADVPTRSNVQSKAMGSFDTDAIKFVPTSWVRDVAQSTVPFIDSNLIESPELVALSGVGLFYKFQPGYGGYVAPRLITQDYGHAAMRIRGATGVYGV